VEEKKQKIIALLFDNLTGIEVFLLLFLGQLGAWLASGKSVPITLVLSNACLNIVVSVMIYQLGVWREWGKPQMLLVGGFVAVVGINVVISGLKNYARRYENNVRRN